jgi:hypothetical protein
VSVKFCSSMLIEQIHVCLAYLFFMGGGSKRKPISFPEYACSRVMQSYSGIERKPNGTLIAPKELLHCAL